MIITRDLIRSMTCEESVAWFDSHSYFYDLPRKRFNTLLREQEVAGLTPNNWWADWADVYFYKADAIVHNKKLKRLGVYKILAPNLTPQEFDNIDDALAVLEAAKNEHIKQEDECFHVQIRRRGPEGFEILQSCDITRDTYDAPTPDAYFATFNLNTGLYDEYPTYTQAKNRMVELRTARHQLHAEGFIVHEKIAEVGALDTNGEDFVPVLTLNNRKIIYADMLDRITPRPDPEPKKL